MITYIRFTDCMLLTESVKKNPKYDFAKMSQDKKSLSATCSNYTQTSKSISMSAFLFLTEIVWDLPKNNQICCAWKILHIVFKKLLFLHDIPPTCRRPQIEMSHETKHVYLVLVLVHNFVKNLALLSYFLVLYLINLYVLHVQDLGMSEVFY